MTTDRYTTMRIRTYGPDGLVVNPDQGTIPGARIDEAVQKAVDAFWTAMVDQFPEAQFGDMAPGDEVEFEDAALRVARVWVMYNIPGGMARPDPTEQALLDAFRAGVAQEQAQHEADYHGGVTVEDVVPGTPEWDESERALDEQRKRGG